MKDVVHRIQFDLSFLVYWTLANAFGFIIGALVIVFCGGMIYLSGSVLFGESTVKLIGGTLAQIVAVAPLGVCLGLSQWLVLRNRLKRAEWWFLATLIGCLFAGVTLWKLGGVEFANDAPIIGLTGTFSDWLIIGMIMGVTSGLLQMLILPVHGLAKLLWPLLNGLGWAIGLAMGTLFTNRHDVFFDAMIGAAFSGSFTGVLMRVLPIDLDENTGFFISTSQ